MMLRRGQRVQDLLDPGRDGVQLGNDAGVVVSSRQRGKRSGCLIQSVEWVEIRGLTEGRCRGFVRMHRCERFVGWQSGSSTWARRENG